MSRTSNGVANGNGDDDDDFDDDVPSTQRTYESESDIQPDYSCIRNLLRNVSITHGFLTFLLFQ